jgi:hypothetical protein
MKKEFPSQSPDFGKIAADFQQAERVGETRMAEEFWIPHALVLEPACL